MIYITGDTHIPVDIQKLSTKRFPEQKNLSKNDYVIICGDFGGVWDNSNEEKYWIKWLMGKNFSTLFVDGNHENFQILNSFETVGFCGGRARKIDEGIYHLLRGEIYTIENKRFFTFGGADSHDKELRTEGKNWWKEELPSTTEYENARKNLDLSDWKVDYIITHCAPTSIQENLAPQYNDNELTTFFEGLKGKVKYKKWFFGHYHCDGQIDINHTAVFNYIISV